MTGFLLDGRGVVIPAAGLALVLALLSVHNPLLAVGALGAVVLLLAVAANSGWILLALVAAFPWRGLLKYPTEQLSVVKILGVLLVTSYLLRLLARRERIRAPSPVVAAILLGFFVAVALVFSLDPAGSISKTLRYALFIGFFILLVELVRDAADVRRVIRVFTLSASLGALWALVAFLQGDITRAAGPIEEPVDFGFLLACTLPLAGYLIVRDRGWRPVWVACFLVMTGAMFATLSRGAVLGLVALAIWALLTRKIPLKGIVASTLAMLGLLAVAFALWGPTIHERLHEKSYVAGKNVDARQAFWYAAERISLDHPLTGVGPGQFGPAAGGYVLNSPISIKNPVVHDSYLEVLVDAGIFAALCFLAYLALVWARLGRTARAARLAGDRELLRLTITLQGSLVVCMASALFLSQQLAIPFWILGGLGTVVGCLQPAPAPEAPVPERRVGLAALPA
ncbi:MAG: O-antigen ligase family protein [Thermoleophilaceae bacterium]